MVYELEMLKQIIWKLQGEQRRVFQELSKLPEGRLYQERQGGRTYSYHIIGKGKGRIVKGVTKNQKLIYQLARKEYLLVTVKKQEAVVKWVNLISAEGNIQTWHDAVEEAAMKFPAIPPEVFLLGDQYDPNPTKRSTMFLEGTIHRTKRGIMVRSKSELFIADMLESLGIPYQYEVDLPYDDYHLCPDFTVIRPRDGKVLFWEHFGMTHDEEYLRKMDLKLVKYRNMGVVPWDNLIISYDKADGSLDVSLIRALVEGWLK